MQPPAELPTVVELEDERKEKEEEEGEKPSPWCFSQTLPFTPARPLFRPLRAMHHCSAISLTRPVHAPTSQAGGKPASGWGRGPSWARVSQALPAAVVNASQNGRSCLAAIAPSAPGRALAAKLPPLGWPWSIPVRVSQAPKLRAVAQAWQLPSCVCLLGSQVSRAGVL